MHAHRVIFAALIGQKLARRAGIAAQCHIQLRAVLLNQLA